MVGGHKTMGINKGEEKINLWFYEENRFWEE